MPSVNIEKKIIFYFNNSVSEKFIESDGEKNTESKKIISTIENVVLPGEVLARIINPNDPRYNDAKFNTEFLKPDFVQKDTKNVMFNTQTQEFISVIYGFAKIENKQIVVEPIVEYSANKMRAWAYIYRSASKNWPEMNHIKSIIECEKIIFPLEDNQIRPFLNKIENEGKSGERILIAEGTPPKNGRPELIELKKEMTLKIGKIDKTGRIDYKEKDSFIIVKEGEPIAEILPERPPEKGVDVFGKEIPATIEGENLYRVGANVKKDDENPRLLVSAIDGVLEIDEEGKINVENKLTVQSSVNLETGNVHFPGSVEIKGSVEPGFTVEADGNVIIRDNVEDAKIISGGTVIVLNGIMGKEKVFVDAKETIKCKFTQNADLKAGKEIQIKESAIQTKAFAKESIQVGGSVIGGELVARHYLLIETAGSTAGVKTYLTAGRDPEIEKKIEELTALHSDLSKKLKDIIDELSQLFGEDFINKIKTILPTLPQQRKAQVMKLIKEMSDVNNQLTQIKAEREKIKSQLVFDEPPYIRINNEVFSEVYIRIMSSIKKVENKIPGKITFKEDPTQKIIFWE